MSFPIAPRVLTGVTMFIDSRSLPDQEVIEVDLCIAGAGAAGITIAREFIGRDLRVCLLESGGLEHDEETQDLARGEVIGLPYFPLELAQCRYFGGTTNTWSGLCRPLDEIDFEVRDWVPHSGWPFTRSHLEPYYARARSILQLGPLGDDSDAWEGEGAKRWPLSDKRVKTTIFQFSPPTRFGEVYRDEFRRASTIRVFLYANVTEIETDDAAGTVSGLRVATLAGNEFRVSARCFVLAMGGLEIPRLLLLSNKRRSAGLGNTHDLVGRFFMEHPHLESGAILPSDPGIDIGFYDRHRVNGVVAFGALAIADEILRRDRMLNFSASLAFTVGDRYEAARRSEGASSLRYLYRDFRYSRLPRDFWHHLAAVIADIDEVAIDLYGEAFGEVLPIFGLYNRTEQAPDPDSRITLSTDKDRLGLNRVRLLWRLSAFDRQSIQRAHEIIGRELGRSGLGRLRIDIEDTDTGWPESLKGGGHLMGTTRMHADPRKGVVDAQCRVHGISNLYISGPSVFPTGGYANPMLTIVALALRLADHLKRVMS